MEERLLWGDYLTIGIYFAVVLAVGLWSTFVSKRGNVKGYFLAGKSMHWIMVGASIYASNIGAPMFIGLTGTGAASGVAVTIYEWHAIFCLMTLGWFYMPIYTACGAFTMPEYIRKRYGGRRLTLYYSIVSLLGYIVFNISAEFYTGAIFMRHVLDWNMYLCVCVILLVTAIYTTVGGLTSVIFTDTLQTVVLIVSAIILFFISIMKVGGFEGLNEQYMTAFANNTLSNQSLPQCALPRKDSFHIFRDPVTADIPATGVLLGLTVMGLYTWDNDQIIVQRALSAKNLSHAKAGTLLGGILKLTGFLIFIIPGMVSRVLFPEEVACADPDSCQMVCSNKAGCSNIAYPLLVVRVMPSGLRGLMLAALLAAMMSSLTSILNSASSIVTMDIWRRYRRKAKEFELLVVGRVTVLVLVVISILWLPILERVQGGIFWVYFISIRAYLLPPLFMMFFLGAIWKRTTEKAVFWGLMSSLVVGIIRLVLDITYPAPLCGSGEEDARPAIVSKIEFLHFSTILSVFALFVMVGLSFFTSPRPAHKLHKLTWWTRKDEEDPELTSDEEDSVYDDNVEMETLQGGRRHSKEGSDINNTASRKRSAEMSNLARFGHACKTWICGKIDDSNTTLSRLEREEIKRKMTSIEENPMWTRILNATAIVASCLVFFLIGIYA